MADPHMIMKGEGSNANWITNPEGYESQRIYNTVDTSLNLEPDPDLIVEVEIPLNLHTDRTSSSGYRRWPSSSSGRSSTSKNRRINTGKSSENKTITASSVSYKSRGRPIKPHEPEPFLSVDNLSPEKIQAQIEMEQARTKSSKEKRARTPLISTNHPYPFWSNNQLPQPSPYSSPVPPRSRYKYRKTMATQGRNRRSHGSWSVSRSGTRTPNSMIFVSPNQSTKKTNHHVKSPFKHNINHQDFFEDRCQTPSQNLKERTAVATYHISKLLGKEKTDQQKKIQGKLLKGKLKPLKPVNVNGPSIKQCRGIVSETRTYDEPASRTLARRRELVQTIPNVHEYLYDRPRTVESIHRTSEASSVDENRDPNKEGESDRGLDTERSEFRLESEGIPAAPPASLATMYKTSDVPGTISPSPRMPITEEEDETENKKKSNIMPAFKEISVTNPPAPASLKLPNELRQMAMPSAKQATSVSLNSNNSNIRNRPHTAGSNSSQSLEKKGMIHRPNTAGDRSKSVRFADDSFSNNNIKDIKDLKNSKLSEQNKSNGDGIEKVDVMIKDKTSGKVSCKPNDDDSIFKKDDDNDENDKHRRNHDNSQKFVFNVHTSQNTGISDKESDNSDPKNTGGKQHKEGSFQVQQVIDVRNDSCHKDSNLLCVQSDKKDVKKDLSLQKLNTRRSRCSSSKSQPNVLSVGSVLHGSQIHHFIGPESPHRSRSPSPATSPGRQPSSPKLSQPENIVNSARSQVHKVRPSSAHLSGRSSKTRRSRSLSLQSDSSEVTKTSKPKKVYFEKENPPHDSVFVEDGTEIMLKEERTLTFDEIEREILALQQDIKENRSVEEVTKIMMEDEEEGLIEDNVDLISIPSHDLLSDEEEAVEEDTVRDDVQEYTKLLDVYRKKCMEVSETCGELSDVLKTPRKSRPFSGRHSQLNRRNSYHFEDTHHKRPESAISKDDTYKLMHVGSQLSIATDSGCSMGSLDTLKGEQILTADTNNPVKEEIVAESSDKSAVESNLSDKSLLEFVCEQLPPVEKIQETDTRKQSDTTPDNDLQIVAEPKKLSKVKSHKAVSPVTAPFAPLCFTINARPPPGYVYYFAYGPDMNPYRVSTFVCRDIKRRFWGLLFGFNLVLNKKGSDPDAGGFANIEFNPFCSTEGCIYEITPEELELLDRFVGYPVHYEHLMLPVWMMNSNDPDQFGVAQYCVPAVTYIAQDKWVTKDDKLDSEYSLSQCVKSSDLVTPNYRDHLVNLSGPIPTQDIMV